MASLNVGDMITINEGCTNVSADSKYNGKTYSPEVFEKVYEVRQVGSPSMGDDYIAFGTPGGSDYIGGQWNYNVTPVGDTGIEETDVQEQEVVEEAEPFNIDIAGAVAGPLAVLATMVGGPVIGGMLAFATDAVVRSGVLDEALAEARESQGKAMVTSGSIVQNVDGVTYYADKETGELYSSWAEYQAAMAKKAAYMSDLEQQSPKIIQNTYNFPKVASAPTSSGGMYTYNYYMDYADWKGNVFEQNLAITRKGINLDVRGRNKLFKSYNDRYNKYKIQNPDDRLHKAFAHVFFVRPDCHIFTEGTNGTAMDAELAPYLKTQPEFYYAKRHSPELLRQLTQPEGMYDHQFMFYLSNKIRTFEIQDEMLMTDTYGQGLTGYKLQYGRDNVESRTAGNFSIAYVDDRDLHIYNLHKLWIDYISYVYRGKALPKEKYIQNKILDYATSLYYILCAEDGETIIFWTKYWGVFPVEAPSSAFSHNAEAVLHDPEFQIEYRYSWKEDFNPLTLVEFNSHSPQGGQWRYTPSYNEGTLGTGYTWGGCPFIETFFDDADLPYTFKLRFRKDPYSKN